MSMHSKFSSDAALLPLAHAQIKASTYFIQWTQKNFWTVSVCYKCEVEENMQQGFARVPKFCTCFHSQQGIKNVDIVCVW